MRGFYARQVLTEKQNERLRQKKGTGANILAGFRRWAEPTRRAKNLIAPTSYGISIDWRLNIAHENLQLIRGEVRRFLKPFREPKIRYSGGCFKATVRWAYYKKQNG